MQDAQICMRKAENSQKYALMREYMQKKREKSRIKEASAEAIGASADEVSYRVTSGTALRDFFGVLT